MLNYLPIMLCYSAQIFDLLCSILCSSKRFVLKILAVLLEYIHLHHNFNVLTVEYIDLQSYFQSSTTYYAGIMLDAFSYLLCSKLCWHNRLVPSNNRASLITDGNVFMYIKNNSGPRALPCGIPPFINAHGEYWW